MTKNRPALSIGMPIFNGERYASHAISSLLCQSFEDFELIISDNSSTDSTELICRKFSEQDTRIRYVRQPENLGALRNFEFLLGAARADFFMWAACDDAWSPDWIKEVFQIAHIHRCACYGRVHVIDGTNKTIKHIANMRAIEFTGSRLKRRIFYFLDPGMRGKANAFYSVFPTVTLRRAWEDALSQHPAIKQLLFSDTLILYAFLAQSEIRSAPGAVMSKRIHANASSSAITFDHNRGHLFLKRLRSISNYFKNIILSTDWIHYYKLSSIGEKILISLLLPILFMNKLRWKIWRKLR